MLGSNCFFDIRSPSTLRHRASSSEAGASSSEVFTEEKLIADCKLPILHVLAVIYDSLAIFALFVVHFDELTSTLIYKHDASTNLLN